LLGNGYQAAIGTIASAAVIFENETIIVVDQPRSLLVPAIIFRAVILVAVIAAFVYWRTRRK